MSVTIIIPARYASSRYPGKPLAMIKGATGRARSLIERSYEAACKVAGVDNVLVATDDLRISEAVSAFGGAVIMTPSECANGTERVAACLADRYDEAGIFVNFQGDALLTPPDLVEALIQHMQKTPSCEVATVAVRCSSSAYRHLLADQAAGRSGGTTAITRADGNALYFSKRVLPFIAPGDPREAAPPVLMHLGLYAYRADALRRYQAASPSLPEQVEGLEQLRFLDMGTSVFVVEADPPAWDAIELNNPTDLPMIEAILSARAID